MMIPELTDDIEQFRSFLDRSPTPYHAVNEAALRLAAAGFTELLEADAWNLDSAGMYFLRRGGSLVAFRLGYAEPWSSGVRVAAAHTDSPALKLKLDGETLSHGLLTMPVEVYGGAIVSTWLDRSLGIAGRVSVLNGNALSQRLFTTDGPVATVPNLAIHLNRTINEGFEYNKQTHLPVLLDSAKEGDQKGKLKRFLAERLEVAEDTILDADLILFDAEPARLLGIGAQLLSSGRIDNLAAASATVGALCSAGATESTALAVLYNHEEIGSRTPEGADSGLLRSIIERIVIAKGGGREELHRTLARSFLISNDAAHAVHPNYAEKHDPSYMPHLNGGPVLKYNGNLRYSTTAETAAYFKNLCGAAGVPFQQFVNRSDIQSGSTVGPIASAAAELRAVDVGIPILAMHSIREVCGATDHLAMGKVLALFFGSAGAAS